MIICKQNLLSTQILINLNDFCSIIFYIYKLDNKIKVHNTNTKDTRERVVNYVCMCILNKM